VNFSSSFYEVKDMRKLRHYHELLSHREHYIQLLRSGQIKTQAHSLIQLYIKQLTLAINEQWSEQNHG
jgi:hypothetical protein